MNTFSFVIHPMELKRDAARKYPILKLLPEPAIEQIALRLGPKFMSEITGVRSITGSECKGYFVGCPLSAQQLRDLPTEMVYTRLVDAGKFSADLGAKIMGLGAFTSVAGDAGQTVAQRLEGIINVTSGNSYTVYTAVEGLLKAAELMEIAIPESRVAIVGATGSIGAVCAKILSPQVAEIFLMGRDMGKLEALADEVRAAPGCTAKISVATDFRTTLRQADLILAVSAAGKELIFPEDLKVGAVVCDVARPRDVSKTVVEKRDDVLVIEGGVIDVPGDVNFNFNFGFPDKTAYACMSETMLMALEGTYESYTLGRDLTVEQVNRIGEIAKKHGFALSGFRSFETAVTDETIAQVRANARRRRSGGNSGLPMAA
jgi:predicted amino acid dehydrogenase